MVSREKDILQIRKYLNGELNVRAMHELERRAQDDPFLADALEGFEQADGDQQANLNDLSDRLQQRIAKKERRIIPWGPLSIAASILIIIGAGIWLLSGNQQPEKTARLAQELKVEKKEPPVISAPSPVSPATPEGNNSTKRKKLSPPETYSDKNTYASKEQVVVRKANKAPVVSAPTTDADRQAEEFYKPQKDSVAANELIVKDMSQKKPRDAGKMKEVAASGGGAPAAAETLLQSRAEGVSATPPNNNRTISGVVMDYDGQPITGATVKVVGRPFGVVTDVNGKFTLPDVSKDQTLAVNYIGYSSKKVKVNNGDALNISLQPAGNSLSEVAVTKRDNDHEVIAQDARPQQGWQSYNEYLNKNAQSPDGKRGKVKVSFTVAADGSLSGFKVIKRLSEAADKKAIDLISNGPAWAGGGDKKAKEVKVSVSFK
ncbi:MAG: hypothetical protein JWP78_3836 [Mucilaginibacter sp.]|nr:hypothetical protein [Mucilaginibacter sp.]